MNQAGKEKSMINIIGLVVCLSLFGDLSLFAVLPTHYEDIGLSFVNIGITLSIHRLIRIPGNPLAGFLVDRWGRRKPLLFGMVFAVLSTTGYGLLSGLIPILAARIFWGFAWMLINISALSMVIDISGKDNRGKLTGSYTAWYMLGLTVGPVFGGVFVDLIGFQFAMILCSLFTLAGLVVAFIFVSETKDNHNQNMENGPDEPARAVKTKFRAIKFDVWIILIIFLVVQFTGEGIALSTLSLKVSEVTGSQSMVFGLIGMATAGGFILGFRSIISALTSQYFGNLSDRRLGRFWVVVGSIILGMLGYLIIGLADNLPILLMGIIVSACSAGATISVLVAWLGDLITDDQRGMVMGLYSTFGDVGSTLGPIFAYSLFPLIGLRNVYITCSFLFSLCLPVIWTPKILSKRLNLRFVEKIDS